jgi:hypothetical protein
MSTTKTTLEPKPFSSRREKHDSDIFTVLIVRYLDQLIYGGSKVFFSSPIYCAVFLLPIRHPPFDCKTSQRRRSVRTIIFWLFSALKINGSKETEIVTDLELEIDEGEKQRQSRMMMSDRELFRLSFYFAPMKSIPRYRYLATGREYRLHLVYTFTVSPTTCLQIRHKE